jgi:sulfide:quinone oxidoreductase
MNHLGSSSKPFHVVIAGGGIAGLEAALALTALSPSKFKITLVAPEEEFVLRGQAVTEPFGGAPAQRVPLVELAEAIGAEFVSDTLAAVDGDRRLARLESGPDLHYDAVLLALGARPSRRYEHATTVDGRRLDDLMHGLIQDIEDGYTQSVAFVAPDRIGWPLPLYELALLTSARAYEMCVDPKITLITPEATPLEAFGAGAGHIVQDMLESSGIELLTLSVCEIPEPGKIELKSGETIEAQRIVALPELHGHVIPGVPARWRGFVPVDPYGRVRGAERMFAAGDGIDFPIKHGSLAAQQADAAARSIAALAGLMVAPEPARNVIAGVLVGGEKPLHLSARVGDGTGTGYGLGAEQAGGGFGKLSATYLPRFLREHGQARSACA